jgi:hypothetical protein
MLWESTTGYLSIKYNVHIVLFHYLRFWDMDSRDMSAEILEEIEMLRLSVVDRAFSHLSVCGIIVLPFTESTIVCLAPQIF